MPWTVGTFHKKRWYHSPWPWISIAIIASLAFLVLPHAQTYLRQWNEQRRISRATDAYTRGEYSDAIVNARAALQRNPHSIEATRIFAKSLEALKSPEAFRARQHLLSIGGNDAENLLAIATGFWKAGDPDAASRTLSEIPTDGRNSAGYHEIAARVAGRRGESADAAIHWAAAAQLAPGNAEYALEHSAAELRSKTPATRDAALTRLTAALENPATRLAALRILLGDASSRQEPTRALELATELAAAPSATFADQIKRLTILHARRQSEAQEVLAQLQEQALPEPRNIYLLVNWMNENNLALAVPEWAEKFTPETKAVPQIKAALADATSRGSDWAKLKSDLEGDSWEELDFLRYAYLCRAAERAGDELAATAAWSNALAATNAKPWPLETLGRTILAWGWDQKTEQVLGKLAESGQCPRWAADYLWKAGLAAGDSHRLYLASRALAQLDPQNLAARNNYIALALLTGQDTDSPHKLAAALFQQAPQDPVIATTYGLSLMQQGRTGEAVTVMSSLPKEKLRLPNIALYYGIFLTGAGKLTEAKDYLQLAASAAMLPEERALYLQAGGETTAADSTRTR
jgi:Tfp pilus assembly protein PilF